MNREIVGGGGASIYPLNGDVESTPGSTTVTVVGLQNIPVITSFPTGGEVLTYDGPTNTLLLEAPLSQVELQTNGVDNSTQTLLNLVAGTNVTLTEVAGAVTIDSTGGGGSGIGRSAITTNANGSYYTWTDGLIEQWGSISIPSSGTNTSGGVITFPLTFPTAVMNVQVSLAGLPNSGSFVDQASIQMTAAAVVTGVSVQMQCSVPTGGGGTTFNQTTTVYWRAIGN